MGQPFADAAGWHPGPVVLRKSWQRVLLPAVLGPLFPLLVPVIINTTSRGPGVPADAWVLLPVPLVLVAAVVGAVADRRRGVVLDAGALTVGIGWRKRQLAASDIAAVTLEREVGTRTVTLWMRDGGRHRLAAAGRTEGLFRQHFERDWHVIGQWWLANRGGDWQAPAQRVPIFATSWQMLNGFDWRP